ncbi:telomere length regulation protein-domain-containing protein [Limtongia smithiae]|uniref:telomere length regulation protein-domain-containing protein n=1 Tax=Limtongia smithiae TaxID=1125753 RepID=UPI0034CE9F51
MEVHTATIPPTLLDRLKSATDISTVADVLHDYAKQFDPATSSPTTVAAVVAQLLSTTLPELYDGLATHQAAKRDLRAIFTSVIGIGSLLSNLNRCLDALEKLPHDEGVKHQVLVSLGLLSEVVVPGVLGELWAQIRDTSREQLYWNEISSFFVGGKIVTAAARAHASKVQAGAWEWMAHGDRMTVLLAKEIVSCFTADVAPASKLAKFCASLLGMGYPKQFFQYMLVKERFELVVTISQHMQALDTTSFVLHLLRYLQLSYFESVQEAPASVATKNKVFAVAAILVRLVSPSLDGYILKQLQIGLGNQLLRRTVVAWLVFHGLDATAFDSTLKQWADKTVIRNVQITRQEIQTELLFLMLPRLTSAHIHRIAQSAAFLDGVTNRLEATSANLRFMGMSLAMAINVRDQDNPAQLNFGEVPGFTDAYLRWESVSEFKDVSAEGGDREFWRYLETTEDASRIVQKLTHVVEEIKCEPRVSFPESGASEEDEDDYDDDDDDDDDDDGDHDFHAYDIDDDGSDDSDDDPTLRRDRVTIPIYLIDLISYFREPDQSKAITRTKLALMHAAKLILRKASYGTELADTSCELAQIMCGLKNTYNFPNFEQNKLNAMVALVATAPENVGPLLAENITFGDFSMQERLVMLSSLALGAMHISGKQIYNFLDVAPNSLFTSELLPDRAHELFLSESDDMPREYNNLGVLQVNAAALQIQKGVIATSVAKAAEENAIAERGVLRVSRRLQVEREREIQRQQPHVVAVTNRIGSVAGRSLFFPLAAHWRYFTKSVSRNSYNMMLVAHYIKTLGLILSASYPASPEIYDMSSELLSILSTIRLDSAESLILDAVLTGVLVVIDVNDDEEMLITNFSRQLIDMKDFFERTWESIPDVNTSRMAAGAVIRIHELLTKWERRLLGEY